MVRAGNECAVFSKAKYGEIVGKDAAEARTSAANLSPLTRPPHPPDLLMGSPRSGSARSDGLSRRKQAAVSRLSNKRRRR